MEIASLVALSCFLLRDFLLLFGHDSRSSVQFRLCVYGSATFVYAVIANRVGYLPWLAALAIHAAHSLFCFAWARSSRLTNRVWLTTLLPSPILAAALLYSSHRSGVSVYIGWFIWTELTALLVLRYRNQRREREDTRFALEFAAFCDLSVLAVIPYRSLVAASTT